MKTTAKAMTVKSPEGLKTTTSVRDFEVACDEPVESGGTNLGMNPMELLLASLGSCMTIAAFYLAPAQGIKVNAFSVELEGDVDPDGFMGLNPEVRNGFSEIRITPHISCDAPADKAREFVELVASRCPVHDTIENGTKIDCVDIVVE